MYYHLRGSFNRTLELDEAERVLSFWALNARSDHGSFLLTPLAVVTTILTPTQKRTRLSLAKI